MMTSRVQQMLWLLLLLIHQKVSGARDAASGPISSKIFGGAMPNTANGLGFPGPLLPSAKKGEKDKVELLFVQHAQSATVQYLEPAGQERKAQLTLRGVAPSVTYFSNKPHRVGGQLGNALWTSPDFSAVWSVPPNAALYGTDQEGPHTLVMTLYDPVYNASTASLSFNVTIFGEHTEEVHDKEVSSFSLPTLPAVINAENATVLQNAALFVDNMAVPFSSATGAGYSGSTACLIAPGCLSPLICGTYCCDWRSGRQRDNSYCGY
eukprot:jgi/Botrbrau1/12892/Bobra.0299s0012.1